MYNRALLKYFKDINIFCLSFSLIVGLVLGSLWSIITFASFGVVIGLVGFEKFKQNEYYAYYNLGFTKASLIKKVWFLNALIAVLMLIFYLAIT